MRETESGGLTCLQKNDERIYCLKKKTKKREGPRGQRTCQLETEQQSAGGGCGAGRVVTWQPSGPTISRHSGGGQTGRGGKRRKTGSDVQTNRG